MLDLLTTSASGNANEGLGGQGCLGTIINYSIYFRGSLVAGETAKTLMCISVIANMAVYKETHTHITHNYKIEERGQRRDERGAGVAIA